MGRQNTQTKEVYWFPLRKPNASPLCSTLCSKYRRTCREDFRLLLEEECTLPTFKTSVICYLPVKSKYHDNIWKIMFFMSKVRKLCYFWLNSINNWFIRQRAFIEIWSTREVWRARKMRKSCSRRSRWDKFTRWVIINIGQSEPFHYPADLDVRRLHFSDLVFLFIMTSLPHRFFAVLLTS